MTELIAGVRIYDILILLLIFALPAVIRTAVEAFRRKKYENDRLLCPDRSAV